MLPVVDVPPWPVGSAFSSIVQVNIGEFLVTQKPTSVPGQTYYAVALSSRDASIER